MLGTKSRNQYLKIFAVRRPSRKGPAGGGLAVWRLHLEVQSTPDTKLSKDGVHGTRPKTDSTMSSRVFPMQVGCMQGCTSGSLSQAATALAARTDCLEHHTQE